MFPLPGYRCRDPSDVCSPWPTLISTEALVAVHSTPKAQTQLLRGHFCLGMSRLSAFSYPHLHLVIIEFSCEGVALLHTGCPV